MTSSSCIWVQSQCPSQPLMGFLLSLTLFLTSSRDRQKGQHFIKRLFRHSLHLPKLCPATYTCPCPCSPSPDGLLAGADTSPHLFGIGVLPKRISPQLGHLGLIEGCRQDESWREGGVSHWVTRAARTPGRPKWASQWRSQEAAASHQASRASPPPTAALGCWREYRMAAHGLVMG